MSQDESTGNQEIEVGGALGALPTPIALLIAFLFGVAFIVLGPLLFYYTGDVLPSIGITVFGLLFTFVEGIYILHYLGLYDAPLANR